MTDGLLSEGVVLVVGADGQLGREFVSELARRRIPMVSACRVPGRGDVAIDLTRPQHATQQIKALAPSVVVNAAAYTAVDRAETEPDLARRINAEGPAAMAEACRETGAVLLHFSTDYVFDGTLGRAYREDDAPNPLNEYGRSKLLGEQAVAESEAAHLIIRTSGLYTPGGSNFVATMLRLFRGDGSVRVVDDQNSSPTCARALAAAVVVFLESLAIDQARGLAGLYHLSAAGEVSWYEFACAIHAKAQPAARAGLRAISSEEFAAIAARPACSTLDCGKAADELSLSLGHWHQQLDAVMPEFNARSADDAP